MLRRLLLALAVWMGAASAAFAQASISLPTPALLDTASECTTLAINGMGTASWDVRGTYSGTVTFYVASPTGNFEIIDVAKPDTPGTAVNSTTSTGLWTGPVAGLSLMRACMTSYSSGTAQVMLSAAATGGGGSGGSGGGGGGAVTAGDGDLASIGTTTDAASTAGGGGTLTAQLRRLTTQLNGTLTVGDGSGALNVIVDSGAVTVSDGAGALNVICDSGCSGGTSDTDDASIATGQTVGLSGALNMVYDGSVWRRLTIGTAGTASAQVLTVQGIASMTAIQVADNGGSLTVDGTVTVTDGAGALNVICDSGCSGGTTDTDDGSIASGQTVGLFGSLAQFYNGSAWARWTGAALADNTSNPTIPYVGAFLMCFDGSTWDRCAVAQDWTVGTAIGTTGPGQLLVYSDFDGSALPTITNVDTEGEGVPAAGSIKGVQYMMLVSEDGSLQYGTATTPLVVGDGAGALNVIIDSSATLTVNAHAVTNAGTFAVQVDGNALTSLQLLDDAVFTDDAAFTPATSKGFAVGFQVDETSTDSVDEGDFGVPRMSADRLAYTRTADPCSTQKTYIPINVSTATTTELTAALAGSGNNYYICSLDLVTAAANNVALTDDDTDGCGSVTSGLAGGTSAASGWNFAANGGIVKGNGTGTVYKTGGTNRVVCLVTSAATQLSGSIGVVAAP